MRNRYPGEPTHPPVTVYVSMVTISSYEGTETNDDILHRLFDRMRISWMHPDGVVLVCIITSSKASPENGPVKHSLTTIVSKSSESKMNV